MMTNTDIETHESRDPSLTPRDARELRTELASGGTQCTARSSRTGEPCKRPAMLGSNVCRSHGGNAPQTRAKTKRRLEQAADALVQRLLQFALDGGVDDNVALRAIRDALDRAGLMAKTEVAVEVKAPWEELLGDVAQITKAQHEAMKRGEFAPAPAPALPPADVVDAEVVEQEPPVSPPSAAEDGADAPSVPGWAEPPSAAPTGQLVPLEQAAADVAQANRAARVSQARRRRR